MIFRSPNAEDLNIALTSGHTCVITPAGNDVPAIFHREAIARGALPGGIAVEEPNSEPVFNRHQAIVDALNQMLDGGDENDFTNQGKPDLRKLNGRLGFQIAREEADAVWTELTAAK